MNNNTVKHIVLKYSLDFFLRVIVLSVEMNKCIIDVMLCTVRYPVAVALTDGSCTIQLGKGDDLWALLSDLDVE